AREDLLQHRAEVLLQRGHLLREAVDQRAAADVRLLADPHQQALVQPPQEQIELRVELLRRVRVRVVGVRERDAPDLLALALAEILEELREAGDEVALREQHVDREADAELAIELDDALANRARVRAPLGLRLRHQVRDRDRDERAVDRPALAVLFQQAEKAEPRGLIDVRVAVLRRVAAGRVDQDRIVREPPVAVARAADAADRIRPEALAQREAQTRAHERRGFAGARRADDDVPRQVVQVQPPLAAARLLEHAERVLEAAAHRRELLGGRVRRRRRRRRLEDLRDHPALRLRRALHPPQMTNEPRDDDQQDEQALRGRRLERAPVAEREQRPEQHHDGREADEAQDAYQPDVRQQLQHGVIPAPRSSSGPPCPTDTRVRSGAPCPHSLAAPGSSAISTRRFSARFAAVSFGTSGSVSARASESSRDGATTRARISRTASARRCDRCQFDGKRSVRIGTSSVCPVTSTWPGSRASARPTASINGTCAALTSPLPEANRPSRSTT